MINTSIRLLFLFTFLWGIPFFGNIFSYVAQLSLIIYIVLSREFLSIPRSLAYGLVFLLSSSLLNLLFSGLTNYDALYYVFRAFLSILAITSFCKLYTNLFRSDLISFLKDNIILCGINSSIILTGTIFYPLRQFIDLLKGSSLDSEVLRFSGLAFGSRGGSTFPAYIAFVFIFAFFNRKFISLPYQLSILFSFLTSLIVGRVGVILLIITAFCYLLQLTIDIFRKSRINTYLFCFILLSSLFIILISYVIYFIDSRSINNPLLAFTLARIQSDLIVPTDIKESALILTRASPNHTSTLNMLYQGITQAWLSFDWHVLLFGTGQDILNLDTSLSIKSLSSNQSLDSGFVRLPYEFGLISSFGFLFCYCAWLSSTFPSTFSKKLYIPSSLVLCFLFLTYKDIFFFQRYLFGFLLSMSILSTKYTNTSTS